MYIIVNIRTHEAVLTRDKNTLVYENYEDALAAATKLLDINGTNMLFYVVDLYELMANENRR